MFLYIPKRGSDSVDSRPGFIYPLTLDLFPTYILKVDVACILLAVPMHRSCLVIFFCPQSVKERFLGASFPKASAKVQPFSETARTSAIIFQKNAKIMEIPEETDAFRGNNEQITACYSHLIFHLSHVRQRVLP